MTPSASFVEAQKHLTDNDQKEKNSALCYLFVGEEFMVWEKNIREKFIILCKYIYPCQLEKTEAAYT